MRTYIKEHATEFAGEGGVEADEDAEADAASADGKSLTAAEEYAANTRRQRQNADMSALSWCVDAVVSGAKTIGSGLVGVAESIGDLLGNVPINKETALICLIAILLISNIWTFFFLQSSNTSTPRRTKRHRLQQTYEADDVAEAMRLLLGEHHRSVSPRETTAVAVKTPLEEANDLLLVLADVESQLARIRENIAGVKDPLAPAVLNKQD